MIYPDDQVSAKITRLRGDSALYDYSSLGKLDFVFVDGCHSKKCIEADTNAILPLLAKGATVLWHDYGGGFYGVTKHLNQLGESLPLQRIEKTSLVLYKHV